MSKIDSSGMEHGKRGGKVYQEVRGQQIVKNLYKPTNPRSPKQQQHRAKLAFINRLSAHLAEAVNLGFARVPDDDVKHTPRNAFVKKNWDNGALLWNEETALWELCPDRLKVADGLRYVPDNMTAEVSDGRLYITCPDPGLSQCLVPGPLLPPRYRRPRPCLHRTRQPQPVFRDVWMIRNSSATHSLSLILMSKPKAAITPLKYCQFFTHTDFPHIPQSLFPRKICFSYGDY